MAKDKKGYSPTQLKVIWKGLFDYLDKLFHECKVIKTDEADGDDLCYDLSKHVIKVDLRKRFTRTRVIVAYIVMFIYNLVPGTKRVKYKDADYLMLPLKNLMVMGGKIREEIFPLNVKNPITRWEEHLNKKYDPKLKKKVIPKIPITKQDLSYMYYDKKLTKTQIAEVLGIGVVKMNLIFRHYDLPGRHAKYVYISPNKLADLYYEQDFTIAEIARILDVAIETVNKKLVEYNIPKRDKRYTTPIFMARSKVFKSQLRKQLRLNPAYAIHMREVMDHFDRDPDLKPETAKVEKENN